VDHGEGARAEGVGGEALLGAEGERSEAGEMGRDSPGGITECGRKDGSAIY